MTNTEYGEKPNALATRGVAASSAMKSAWLIGIILSVITTVALFASKSM